MLKDVVFLKHTQENIKQCKIVRNQVNFRIYLAHVSDITYIKSLLVTTIIVTLGD